MNWSYLVQSLQCTFLRPLTNFFSMCGKYAVLHIGWEILFKKQASNISSVYIFCEYISVVWIIQIVLLILPKQRIFGTFLFFTFTWRKLTRLTRLKSTQETQEKWAKLLVGDIFFYDASSNSIIFYFLEPLFKYQISYDEPQNQKIPLQQSWTCQSAIFPIQF